MTESCLKEDLRTKMKDSPILVVGAGGIGCELLKNLVMTGFHNIEVVDLDTIEVSNLNRQFLFQKKHVGMSKAKVARESVLRFNPNAKITAHHGSIIDPNFNVEYFKKFKIVLNALDNIQARMHVNRMCLASGVPLIESGSAGYSGQVELIIKGLSKCYECEVKREPKTYATCTIRNTPSLPIHCIVWAKFLFNQLFGEADADEDVSPDTVTDPELINSGNEYKAQTKSTRVWAQENNYDPQLTFTKLFTDDVNYLLTLTDLWENRRTKPVPIVWGQVKEVPQTEQQTGQIKDQIIWSLKKCVAEFCDSLTKLKEAYQKLEPGNFLVWDKDEDDHMNFVVATANLRASVFGIPLKSKFDIKSMAGNIIPAIATSNAVIAGMVTHYAMNVIEGRYKDCPSVYLREKLNARNASIVPESLLIPPNPECRVCGKSPQVTLVTDVEKLTIKSLENDVLKKTLNMPAPDVSLDQRIIISSEPGETEENLDKTLKEMNIVDGSTLFADDFIQTYEVKIFINHRVMEVGEPDFFVVGDLKELAKEVEQIANLKDTKNGETAKKRKQEMTQVPAKKRKTDSAVADDDSDIEMFDDNQESDDDVTIVA